MQKKDIFYQIKKLHYFNGNIDPLLELLEDNLSRIEFAKEIIGLPDLVFLAEEGADEFEDKPLFACFDVSTEPGNDEMNFISMKKSMIVDFNKVISSLMLFFEQTDRTLYVCVAFKDSSLQQEDMFRVLEQLNTKKESSKFEAIAKFRKYPTWFEAKFPSEIIQEKILLNTLVFYEEKTHKLKQMELITAINQSLDENDRETFFVLSQIYKKIY